MSVGGEKFQPPFLLQIAGRGRNRIFDVMDKLINLPEDTVLYPHEDWVIHISVLVTD